MSIKDTPAADDERLCTFSGEWKMEFVGWCWDDEHWPLIRHFLPNDGGEAPIRDGIRKVYAPLSCDGDAT